MAGILIDSFDHYLTADHTAKWTDTINTTINTTGGRRGGGALSSGTSAGESRITPNYPVPSGATCVCGVAVKKTSVFTGGNSPGLVRGNSDHIFCVMLAGSDQVWLRVNADATLSVVRSNQAVLGTSTFALQQNVYAYVEMKVLLHTSAGTVDVRVNGASWISLTGQNTQPLATATWNQFSLGGLKDGLYDDFYMLDGTGSYNNDLLGDVRVDAIYPNADGSSSQFTRSTGSDQYATIDETTPNSDTDYNSTATVSNRDSLNFPNAPVTGATIYMLQASAFTRKVDSGSAGIKLSTRISGTYYDGTEVSVGALYNYARQIWERKPSDSTVWLDTDVNAAEFGYIKSS